MIYAETPLKGVFLIEINKIGDERGFFGRSWCKKEMQEAGLNPEITYLANEFHDPGMNRGIRYNDSQIGIEFPIESAVIVESDRSWPDFSLNMLT